MNCLVVFLFLFISVLLTTIEAPDPKHGEHMCSDFNRGSAQAALAGIENTFVCPADGYARKICAELYPLKNVTTVVQSQLKWYDIV
jgi:hypothetical protein